MRTIKTLSFLSLTLLCQLGKADTITLQNNAEINGRTSYKNGTFTLSARYHSGTKTIKLDRVEVREIEVNTRDFNSGEPPRDISIFVDHANSTRNASEDESNSSAQKSRTAARATQKEGQSAAVEHEVIGSGNFNPSTDDVAWLRTKARLIGRLVSIDNGSVVFAAGKERKQFLLEEVARILVAPH